MEVRRISIIVFILITIIIFRVDGHSTCPIIVDSLNHKPLIKASVFDKNGLLLGLSDESGHMPIVSSSDYPITLRYIGYNEKTISKLLTDTVFMSESVSQLQEVVVAGNKRKMWHILAYVREYSTLASYTDTVTMFREKMIDFMWTSDKKMVHKGWQYPRVLESRSYYQFTNAEGLDSVSDRCNYHFSWSDWIGLFPTIQMPTYIVKMDFATDTIFGRYGPAEIWTKQEDKIRVTINVMTDSMGRRWVPGVSSFFENQDIDFEQFTLNINYNNIVGQELTPLELTSYSFNIDSRGRGRGMFKFNRKEQPFFVTTYSEWYILDKELISLREVKEWEKLKYNPNDIEVLELVDVPALQPHILALKHRVNAIDADQVHLSIPLDDRLLQREEAIKNFQLGRRAIQILKNVTGISNYKTRKNIKNKWEKFKDSRGKGKNKR